MTTSEIHRFQKLVLGYYHQHGRHNMAWRQPPFDPYRILVSEIMLQQTQVTRVAQKFPQFLAAFPSVEALAAAPLGKVLAAWNGLGYNRRAKFLWQAAQQLVSKYGGEWPRTQTELTQLPGVGQGTAGAILAYAYNLPAAYLETNIRTVYIHRFFKDRQGVTDSALLPLVAETVRADNPREWYWALMDYGAYLKQTVGNASKASKSYAKQSQFKGSLRQLRGEVLRLLIKQSLAAAELQTAIRDERLPTVLLQLEQELLVSSEHGVYKLG